LAADEQFSKLDASTYCKPVSDCEILNFINTHANIPKCRHQDQPIVLYRNLARNNETI